MKRGEVLLKKMGRADDPNPHFHFTVPKALAIQAGLEAGMRFRPELTDEGILYRPVGVLPMDDPRPVWRRKT